MPSQKRQRQRAGQQARRQTLLAQQKRARQRKMFIRYGAIAAVVAIILAVLALNSGGKSKKTNVTSSSTSSTSTTLAAASYGTTACPPTDGSAPRTTTFGDSFKKCIDPAKTYTATMQFDAGTVTIALDAKSSPITVNSFVALSRYHFYDGLTCHRVIKKFVDQCGDPKGDGSGGPGFTIGEEPPKSGKYSIGDLAMAKTSAAHSTGSQFFLIVGDQGAALPAQYSLLGTITSGVDVAHAIEADGADQDPSPPKVVHKIVKVTISET
ncbi:MAG TPA: peptidylprolyl isomerase [Acidimicrobiales bacterium]